MKVFKAPGLTLPELEQMLGEAVVLSRLNHPNIVRIFDANVFDFQGQTLGFFTMEYVAGGSLDQFWRSYGRQFIPVPTAVDIIKQVCRGLDVAHSQDPPIIHRDIKPQNILIGYDKDGLRARVSDFGLAKSVNPLTLMASARGTRCFKSPEAFDDYNSDSCGGDVWAIGTTLYLLLADRLPFELPDEFVGVTSKSFNQGLISPSRLNALADSRLDQIVLKSLAITPQERYTTANEVLTDDQIHELIFLPGFSTAEKTTDVSGRGVGMDVVRRNVNELGGKIEIASELGKGSRFIITLPLRGPESSLA